MGTNSGTIRTKDIKTSYDALTASDSTKAVGHKQTLVAEEGSFIPQRESVGID